ncbi:MAG: hypothetical protein DLM53_05745 [Candidatus Eremiobacter antarcticus]|nr:hypothetical protein [Candidatus Eremiobacteraeota bacterium]MBC5808560.1 hypothetical protein [Candidatus Eremiobacteraeota bacterium]PZR62898.1 MAG: hypothetical protein DLM53_05745 [Candidatus Eremiobacter sp. RRmetagenome_bin22]
MRRNTARVACAQLVARPLEEARKALDEIVAAIAAAARRHADIVVLPECSYPGYVLLGTHPYSRRLGGSDRIPTAAQALARVSAAAARHGIAVAVGIADHAPDASLRNEAVFIDKTGRVAGRYAKNYLWSFDSRWFARGDSIPVFDSDFGPIGMMICADGRVPEIARELVRLGAWLILDPTAWVGYGASAESMQNPQVDYMLAVRAFENGVWIAAADKCGSEYGAVHYVGRSRIVAPDGTTVAEAGALEPEIIIAEVRRSRHAASWRRAVVSRSSDGATVSLTPSAAPPTGRRPGRSRRHTAAGAVWLGVYQAPRGRGSSGIRASEKVDRLPDTFERRLLQTLEAQGVDTIVRTDSAPAQLRRALAAAPTLRAYGITGDGMLGGAAARSAAQDGADLLLWLQPPQRMPVLGIARARALENRIYVLVCARARPDVCACLIDPDGSLVACALLDRPSAFIARVDPTTARRKQVVPGTDVYAPVHA